MRKIALILVFSVFLLTSCDREVKTAIFLGTEPIDPTNCTYADKRAIFRQRQRIYYILVSKEPIESCKLRLQVLRLDKKYPFYKIEPAYGIDINRGPNKHYVTDYFVLHKAGTYVVRIFSHDNFERPLAETEFSVEEL